MSIAFRKAVERGYKRIGLLLPYGSDERVDHLWMASYLIQQHLTDNADKIPPMTLPSHSDFDPEPVMAWYKTYRPEVIIKTPNPPLVEEELVASQRDTYAKALKQWKPLFKKGPAIISLGCHDPNGPVTGIYQNPWLIGRTAVTLLVTKIHGSQWGIPEHSMDHLMQGNWVEGMTLPDRR